MQNWKCACGHLNSGRARCRACERRRDTGFGQLMAGLSIIAGIVVIGITLLLAAPSRTPIQAPETARAQPIAQAPSPRPIAQHVNAPPLPGSPVGRVQPLPGTLRMRERQQKSPLEMPLIPGDPHAGMPIYETTAESAAGRVLPWHGLPPP